MEEMSTVNEMKAFPLLVHYSEFADIPITYTYNKAGVETIRAVDIPRRQMARTIINHHSCEKPMVTKKLHICRTSHTEIAGCVCHTKKSSLHSRPTIFKSFSSRLHEVFSPLLHKSYSCSYIMITNNNDNAKNDTAESNNSITSKKEDPRSKKEIEERKSTAEENVERKNIANEMTEHERRELISKQHRALYGEVVE